MDHAGMDPEKLLAGALKAKGMNRRRTGESMRGG